MRTLLVLLSCFITVAGFSQKQDTVFLKARNPKNGHAIYIDPNKNSKYYKLVESRSFIKDDATEYKESVNRLHAKKRKTISLPNAEELPRDWFALTLYKGKYYVYCPSDWSPARVSLNDSTVIVKQMERGIDRTDGVTKTGNDTYTINCTEDYTNKKSSITIHIVDQKRGIAVFKHQYRRGGNLVDHQALMVDMNKVRNFPLIVNYSPIHKELEFDFEQPDFERLPAQ